MRIWLNGEEIYSTRFDHWDDLEDAYASFCARHAIQTRKYDPSTYLFSLALFLLAQALSLRAQERTRQYLESKFESILKILSEGQAGIPEGKLKELQPLLLDLNVTIAMEAPLEKDLESAYRLLGVGIKEP